MDSKAIAEVLQADLASVPGAEGVNNHEGSLITQDQLKMQSILSLIKQRELFFVDSLTTSNSIAGAVAAELGLKWNQRTVFLDNKTDEAYIAGQLKELLQHAAKTGSAIGICHTRPGTLKALQALAPELERSPGPLVLVKDLVR